MSVEEESIAKLLDAVLTRVLSIINTGQFEARDLEPVVLAVIDVVQVFNDARRVKLTGREKRDLALDLTRRVLDALLERDIIDSSVHAHAVAAVAFAGPALMDGLKALWTKMVAVQEDLATHGCTGCVRRNC